MSIAFHCVSAITYTFVDYYTSTCTSVDGCIFASMTFSSPESFYVVYVFTKCYSTTSSSFDSSMNIRSTDVAHGFFFFFGTPMSFAFVKKNNYKCSNCIYIMNYRLHKLYIFIICLLFCTFQR
jgi:hypothetical protein